MGVGKISIMNFDSAKNIIFERCLNGRGGLTST